MSEQIQEAQNHISKLICCICQDFFDLADNVPIKYDCGCNQVQCYSCICKTSDGGQYQCAFCQQKFQQNQLPISQDIVTLLLHYRQVVCTNHTNQHASYFDQRTGNLYCKYCQIPNNSIQVRNIDTSALIQHLQGFQDRLPEFAQSFTQLNLKRPLAQIIEVYKYAMVQANQREINFVFSPEIGLQHQELLEQVKCEGHCQGQQDGTNFVKDICLFLCNQCSEKLNKFTVIQAKSPEIKPVLLEYISNMAQRYEKCEFNDEIKQRLQQIGDYNADQLKNLYFMILQNVQYFIPCDRCKHAANWAKINPLQVLCDNCRFNVSNPCQIIQLDQQKLIDTLRSRLQQIKGGLISKVVKQKLKAMKLVNKRRQLEFGHDIEKVVQIDVEDVAIYPYCLKCMNTYELYANPPVSLPCGKDHYICSNCIKKQKGNSIRCPIDKCEIQTSMVSMFQHIQTEGIKCNLCLEILSINQLPFESDCGHMFCKECSMSLKGSECNFCYCQMTNFIPSKFFMNWLKLISLSCLHHKKSAWYINQRTLQVFCEDCPQNQKINSIDFRIHNIFQAIIKAILNRIPQIDIQMITSVISRRLQNIQKLSYSNIIGLLGYLIQNNIMQPQDYIILPNQNQGISQRAVFNIPIRAPPPLHVPIDLQQPIPQQLNPYQHIPQSVQVPINVQQPIHQQLNPYQHIPQTVQVPINVQQPVPQKPIPQQPPQNPQKNQVNKDDTPSQSQPPKNQPEPMPPFTNPGMCYVDRFKTLVPPINWDTSVFDLRFNTWKHKFPNQIEALTIKNYEHILLVGFGLCNSFKTDEVCLLQNITIHSGASLSSSVIFSQDFNDLPLNEQGIITHVLLNRPIELRSHQFRAIQFKMDYSELYSGCRSDVLEFPTGSNNILFEFGIATNDIRASIIPQHDKTGPIVRVLYQSFQNQLV